jgi:NADH-quinone oxidoreductase subunit N
MTGGELVVLMPLWLLAGTAVLILLGISVKRSHALSAALGVVGSLAAFVAAIRLFDAVPVAVKPLLVVDRYSLFFTALLAVGGMFVMLLAYGYLKPYEGDREEFYPLVLLAVLGAAILSSSTHFVSLFLGLEILSVALYALVSYPREKNEAVEAGVKYLILASATAAVLLFGMALIYAATGALDFAGVAAALAGGGGSTALILLGFSLMIVGIGFKLAVVPFHMWTPDVYQGSPPPVAALISTVSKGGVFAVLFRFFTVIPIGRHTSLVLLFALVSGASMFTGNLLALRQKRLKRILAYSSIAHLGYLLVAFIAGGGMGVEAAVFYLVAYFIMMTAAFGVVTVLSVPDRDADELEEYRGLFWRRPALAVVLTGALLSLAGIPLTAGFLAKFYVATAGIHSALWALVIILVVNSTIGLYYYLRIIVAMAARVEEAGRESPRLRPAVSIPAGAALLVLAALTVWFGVSPSGLIEAVRLAAAVLIGPGIH